MKGKQGKRVKDPYLLQKSGAKWEEKIFVSAKLLRYFSKKRRFRSDTIYYATQ
jgi:hypothetical protein